MDEFKPLTLVNESGADEQSIAYFYSVVKKQNWYSLGTRWNTVPWGKDAHPNPLVVHFMSTEKPWRMKKDEWPDLAEWYEVYEQAKQLCVVKEHPEE